MNKKRVAYLGPPGTFSEEALMFLKSPEYGDFIDYPSVPDIIRAVESGEIDEGIVPIENSIEGSLNITLDMLIFDVQLLVTREIVVPVDHNLLARKGNDINDIRMVISHPHAVAQCRSFLETKLGRAPVEAANSTAEAALIVSKKEEPWAAISTKLAAELYDLAVLASDIQDVKENSTRFVLLGKAMPPATGDDKTSVVCFIQEDRPGSLLEILQQFASRDINLTKIESRPTKKGLGDYCFFIDLQGHIDDLPVKQAIEFLRTKLREVKFLGSYPRWKS